MSKLIWWKRAAERAAKTAAQGFIAATGVDLTGWAHLDWKQVLVASAGMGLMSLATSALTTSWGGPPDDPSLV